MKLKLPHSTHNWITLIGALIALISLSMIGFLLFISVVLSQSHAYLGLITYIVLPAVMILGLVLIPIGMWITTRRRNAGHAEGGPSWPKVDLNDNRHRNAFLVFIFGTMFLLFVSAVGSYEAFHFTESTTFCGQVCHSVMHPEFVAYQNSPHARVACVDCHVGTGADWYVRSKLSGAYQVYSVIAEKYSKPIETPISNLRPARETCMQCHWPQKFYAHKLRMSRHYLQDEENTEWDIQMVMKIGSEHAAQGLAEGIHWHINPNVKVEYIAGDEKRQEIPWVRYTDLTTGEVTVYTDEEYDLDPEAIQNEEIRVMDCMDCHNRPSHDYLPPTDFINDAITAGAIPQELPEIKYLCVTLCDASYPSMDSAMIAIETTIREYYEGDYPEIVEENPEWIDRAIAGMQDAFSRNIFPDMKVRWDAYPNFIGHMEFNGCFRCHNDTHASESGKVIPKDCNLCHTIVAQGPPDELVTATVNETLEFMHPDGDDEGWQDGLCIDCHTGL